MAHHGDVARSPPSVAALPPSLLAAAPSRAPRPLMTPDPSSEVTLESPRPDGERAANEYVETPFRPGKGGVGGGVAAGVGLGVAAPKAAPGGAVRASPCHVALHLPVGPLHAGGAPARPSKDARTPPPAVRFATSKPHARPPPAAAAAAAAKPAPVSKQPGAVATFKKDAGPGSRAAGAAALPGPASTPPDCSIICSECGLCKCQSCAKPRPLPSCWLCNNMCLVSAETVVDYASCLCCVKGLYYHCVVDGEAGDAALADDPCACGPPRRLSRWGCLGLLSLVLPCLWCYWPVRGCVRATEKCYAHYTSAGCRCDGRRSDARPRAPSDSTPQKRLLDPSPDY